MGFAPKAFTALIIITKFRCTGGSGSVPVPPDISVGGNMGQIEFGMTGAAVAGQLANAAIGTGLTETVAVIADDDEFFRMALAAVLTQTCHIDRVIQAGSYDEAIAAIDAEDHVTLALFDLNMPGMNGPAILHHVREACPHVGKVAVVSASRSREDIIATLAAGAHGFVCKASGVKELQQALGQILQNRIYVPTSLAEIAPACDAPQRPALRPALVPQIVASDAKPATDAAPALSPRQSRVLEMLVHGKSNKEIARELNLGAGTVKVHMAALFAKLGVPNRAAAAVAGTRLLGAA